MQERNRLDKGLSPKAAASLRRHIAWLDDEIAQLEAEYPATLASSAALSQQAELYRSVPGVGLLTAATLVAELPELGQCDNGALAALSGLAPWANDSGKQRGGRHIQGGRSPVAGYFTWRPSRRRGITRSCGISIKTCVSAARRRK